MVIEIRWKHVGVGPESSPRAPWAIQQFRGEKFLGLELQVLNTYPAAYESVGVNHTNWLECQTRFQHYLLPWLKYRGVEDAEIYINGQTIGAWAADLEGRHLAFRREMQRAAEELKATRRFFRNKQVEGVRKRLETLVQALR